jgi:ABC-type multidrug transport system fused ATPase/permease subunit
MSDVQTAPQVQSTSPSQLGQGGASGQVSLVVSLLRDVAAYSGRRGLFALLMVGLGALTEGISLILIIPIISVAMGGAGAASGKSGVVSHIALPLFDRLGLHDGLSRLAVLLAAFVTVTILRGGVVFARDLTLNQLQVGFTAVVRVRVAQRLADARWDVISRLKHARINQVLNVDVSRISMATNLMQQSLISVVMLVAQCVIACVLSPALAVFTLVFVALSALTLAPTLRRAFSLGSLMSRAGMRMISSTNEFLSGLKLAISQDLQGRYVDEFAKGLDVMSSEQVLYTRRYQRRRLVLTVLSSVTAAVVVLVGFGIMKLPAAILFTVLFVLVRMNGPVTQLQQAAQQIVQALPAYQNIRALEDDLATGVQPAVASKASPAAPSGSITFTRVSFRHPDAHDVDSTPLRDFSLTIEPGAFLGITGPSGAGKTTFADLLSGLYPPDTGDVAVGGASLKSGALAAWRRQISYVSQDPFLFHDTIRRNLAWAAADPAANLTDTDLWAALELAGADALVRRMEHGLETVVGERGTLVSGGERQRLALARAILRHPRLLILDEATNAIDIPGERLLLKRLAALKPRPTIVMIAHRAESLDLCDRVVVLKDGGLDMAA